MQIVAELQEHEGYTKIFLFHELDAETKRNAGERFREYKDRGVIRSGSFYAEEWLLYDEVKRRHLKFRVTDGSIQEWTGCTDGCYLDYVRAYVVLLLGLLSVNTIAEICKTLIRLGSTSFDEACSWDVYTLHVLRFLGMIPDSPGYIGPVMERIEENRTLDGWGKKPRKLAGFRFFLRFERMVVSFWETADDDRKAYFFPIYLWWRLTSILPLRATEFLLLPRECIRKKDEKWILTVRRTRLKKGMQKVGYTIDSDFSLHDYEVPEWMAKEILAYKDKSNKNSTHSQDTLFEPVRRTALGYMTYDQMRRKLAEFREEVSGDPDYPVNLGDTRHLAMINLILSGGSPVVCRELAGHESIDISSNYYANLSTVVESAVYEKYREHRGTLSLEGSLRLRPGDHSGMIKVKEGSCDFTRVADGDISECMKSFGRNGKFGDCRNCIHFYPDKDGLRLTMKDGFREKVDEDGIFLMEMIEQVRRGNGEQEDIRAALLRLQNSSAAYRKILEREQGGRS
ncbi:MAG: hypothetical protein MSS90_07525 [Blautia massiliensis]|uniref:hypothetical protein n=1 Tax=Blautia massiliensis (ex Durand et al. 2017) TaxID=1737424 RepID=UPI0024324223|nr:hypothetical protein [Blautia massiliensis (ex Durand et al. 2017)]MCI7603995.1 hypothetical protein [Blautia massiliensis (ex Durand et al. 2017)]